MLTKNTRKSSAGKPSKPYPEFPLFPHATRRWAKKIRGKLHYFGPWSDPDGALQKYLDRRDDLHAGRTPRLTGDRLTVQDLVKQFLTSKRDLVDTGKIVQRTWQDYYVVCERVVRVFGPDRLVTDLAADDFQRLQSDFASTRGPVALGNDITRVRMLFKFAHDNALITQPVRFGSTFKKPSRRVLRKARHANGPRMFEASDIRSMIEAAGVQLKAMILLGVNCGFGNSDVATLPMKAVDLDGGWIDYPRPKTGASRQCPLWPETVAALQEAIATRPSPKNEADAGRMFVTSQGKSWAKPLADNPISKEVAKLLKRLGLHRPGRNFYALRLSFETIGGEARDQVAVDHILGRVREDMASVYRDERISAERLLAVTNYVRNWLFGS